MYSGHLHGIDPVVEDRFFGDGERFQMDEQKYSGDAENQGEDLRRKHRIANADLLGNAKYQKVIFDGGTLTRSTRVSLTCRDVGKVINTRSL